MKAEDRINKALNSLEGMERAKAPEDGFSRIQEKIAAQKNAGMNSSRTTGTAIYKLAAMIAIVLSFNIWAVSNYLSSDNMNTGNSTYSQITTDYNLYEDEY